MVVETAYTTTKWIDQRGTRATEIREIMVAEAIVRMSGETSLQIEIIGWDQNLEVTIEQFYH